MASFNLSLVMFIAMMVACSQLYTTTAQTRHVVGDTFGWGIPTNNGVATYTTWASQQTFTVGDLLFFNYTNGMHDVAEVTAASYDPCTATNPISLTTTGPTTLTLTTPGMHYYICTFAGHCQIGQKLTINVLPSTTATPPSMPPMTPMTPTSPPPTTTPMPPSMTPPMPSPTTTPMPPSMAPPMAPPSTTPMPPSMPPSMAPPSTTPMPPSMSPPAPPPMTPTPTPPPMAPTTPDEPGNGAPSLTAIVPATFLAIGLAFLNY